MKKNAFSEIFKNTFLQIALIIWVIMELFPMLWILMSSFKKNMEIIVSPFSFPKSFFIGNYDWARLADKGIYIGTYYKNSIIIVVVSLVILLFVSLLAGYAIAKLRVPGKNIILIILVGMVAIPIHALIIPLYYFFAKLNILNNILAAVLPIVTINTPFSIIILQAYFRGFPDELIEAAKIDGCGNIRAFFSIVLPISLGSISAVLVINFMRIWNEFFIPLIMLKRNTARTLPAGLTAFSGEFAVAEFGSIYAVIVVSIIPTIIMFIVFSRYMIRGLTAGSIKG